jgi:hypothetical protein
VKAMCRKRLAREVAREADSGQDFYICSTQAIGHGFTGCPDPGFRRNSQ